MDTVASHGVFFYFFFIVYPYIEPTMRSQDAVINEIYQETLAMVQDGFQPSDFVLTIGIIMKVCQLRQDLKGKGSQKKKIAIAVFKLIVTESGLLDAEQAELAGTFILTTLPSLIDTLKTISKEIAEASRSCCPTGCKWFCLSCWCKQ